MSYKPEQFPNWKVLILDQNSPDWHKWREEGIGGSDAAIVMGLTGFCDVHTFWLDKTGQKKRKFELNAAMQHGIDTEPEAREAFIKHTGEYVEPLCGQHSEYEWMKVSLDGISRDGQIIVEIKCPSSYNKHASNAYIVPSYYYCQIQHQLAITKAEFCCFWSYMPNFGGNLLQVYPNEKFIEELIRREELFWNFVTENKEPDITLFPTYNLEEDEEYLPFLKSAYEYHNSGMASEVV